MVSNAVFWSLVSSVSRVITVVGGRSIQSSRANRMDGCMMENTWSRAPSRGAHLNCVSCFMTWSRKCPKYFGTLPGLMSRTWAQASVGALGIGVPVRPQAHFLGSMPSLGPPLTSTLRDFHNSVEALRATAISSITTRARPGFLTRASSTSLPLTPSWLMMYTSKSLAISLRRFSRVPCSTVNVMSGKCRNISSPHARSRVDSGLATIM